MEKVKKEKKQKLRVNDLLTMTPNKIFAGGIAQLTLRDGIVVARWIAIRGRSPVWTIFYGYPEKTEKEIKEKGIRLVDISEVQNLVFCTGAAFERYQWY
jgi:hypothetical protein